MKNFFSKIWSKRQILKNFFSKIWLWCKAHIWQSIVIGVCSIAVISTAIILSITLTQHEHILKVKSFVFSKYVIDYSQAT